MTTPVEVWFRNPDNYIRELVECGQSKVIWDRGRLAKFKTDPIKHAELYFGRALPWEVLVVGEQGCTHYRPDDTEFSPTAVYPVWSYNEEPSILEELIERPVGDDPTVTGDKNLPKDLRPVAGQEHRVIITDLPPIHTGPARAFTTYLRTLQEDNPEVILHVHGLYSYRVSFGQGFRSTDVEPRTPASKGKILLGTGKEVTVEQVKAKPEWVRKMGYKPVDLEVPRNRCMYNIKSAMWAAEYYLEYVNFRTRGTSEPVDSTSTDADFKPLTTKKTLLAAKDMEGDKVACNSCSLAMDCKHYREGAVCSLPGTESKKLASYFNTRDANSIIDGLGAIVGRNVERLERGFREEEDDDEIKPEVTRIVGQVFDQGVKLAKLIDPNLAGGTKVQVNVGSTAQVVSQQNPKQLVANVMREIEATGIPRDQITPEMVTQFLQRSNPQSQQPLVIEQ